MQHSRIVGGSTAKRVINCPGSVALVDQMPPQPSSSYANEGTLLHDTIADILDKGVAPQTYLGRKHAGIELTSDLMEAKLLPALAALDEIDPNSEMEYAVESRVGYGDLLPGVFGSTDLLGRLGDRAIVLDWKFGDGVAVEVEENAQLLFYAAAALRTPETQWVFKGVSKIELIIVQPPSVKRWVTTLERVRQFEQDLAAAVRAALKPDAPLMTGDHCRWCTAKPICPLMTGALDRLVKAKMDALPIDKIAQYLDQVPLVEDFIKDLQQLAHTMIEEGKTIPGWKLVNKRATRKWTDEAAAAEWLADKGVEPYEQKVISPAVAEKALKKAKTELPADLVVAVSTGSTLAPESDPRPAVLQLGHTLSKAMAKLQ
jgi:hypothetical protein